MNRKLDLANYEGLIYSTAARYVTILDDDIEDIQQVLRVKVWKALTRYDASRSKMDVERFVFSCVRNQVKDLLKSQHRRNNARNGSQGYIEDESVTPAFEARYLSESADQVYFDIEDDEIRLPSTLTDQERSVVYLLLMDLNQTEIAGVMKVTRDQVRRLHVRVQEKMGDWRPPSGAAVPLPVAA